MIRLMPFRCRRAIITLRRFYAAKVRVVDIDYLIIDYISLLSVTPFRYAAAAATFSSSPCRRFFSAAADITPPLMLLLLFFFSPPFSLRALFFAAATCCRYFIIYYFRYAAAALPTRATRRLDTRAMFIVVRYTCYAINYI